MDPDLRSSGAHSPHKRSSLTPNPVRMRTGDLATPPRDRLIPVRDLASLLGCTEAEIERLAGHMGLSFEPLPWRGVFLTCLSLTDALALHLALRTPVAADSDPLEITELRAELAQARERAQAAETERDEIKALWQARDRQGAQWADRLNDLELIVAERGRIDRELEAVRAQLLDSQVQQRDLAHRLQIAEESRLLLEESNAARLADEAVAVAEAERARKAHADLQAQWLALRDRGRRDRLAERVRSLRRTLELASLVERNLENYCDRLEQRLLDHGVAPLPKPDWFGLDDPWN